MTSAAELFTSTLVRTFEIAGERVNISSLNAKQLEKSPVMGLYYFYFPLGEDEHRIR